MEWIIIIYKRWDSGKKVKPFRVFFSDYCDESSRSLQYPISGPEEKVLQTNNDPETEDSSWNPKSYERKYFIMDMGCIQTFEYVLVKNSHNHEYRDSSSKIIK